MQLRPVPGLEGRYSASEDGRIWAHRRKHFRTPSRQRNGYLTITVHDKVDGHRTLPVHRLVAMAWLPNPRSLPQVNHKDGRKRNNAVSNLEWCTAQHNTAHAVETGLLVKTAPMLEALRKGREIKLEAYRQQRQSQDQQKGSHGTSS